MHPVLPSEIHMDTFKLIVLLSCQLDGMKPFRANNVTSLMVDIPNQVFAATSYSHVALWDLQNQLVLHFTLFLMFSFFFSFFTNNTPPPTPRPPPQIFCTQCPRSRSFLTQRAQPGQMMMFSRVWHFVTSRTLTCQILLLSSALLSPFRFMLIAPLMLSINFNRFSYCLQFYPPWGPSLLDLLIIWPKYFNISVTLSVLSDRVAADS